MPGGFLSGLFSDATRNIITHELGHGLGYIGHSPTPTDVMYMYVHSSYTLKTAEKNYIRQIYHLYR